MIAEFRSSAISDDGKRLLTFAVDPHDYKQPFPDGELELTVTKPRKKRSLTANSYMWVLLGRIAQIEHIPADELYRSFVRIMGKYTVVPIKTEAVKDFEQIWTAHGLGWFIEDLGESKLDGYTKLRLFHGSSCYDSKEMAALIDEVIEVAKECGIETVPPAELERMKETWVPNREP